MKEPESMDECVYFTRRQIGEKGFVVAWAYRKNCPKCKKSIMGKPKNPKTGKPKIRAKEYTCYECGFTEDLDEHVKDMKLSVNYTCPKCEHKGDIEIPYKRKKVRRLDPESGKKKGVDAFVVDCSKCGEQILITKKLK
jgi:predicted RNA-binding Zn-ribbon protein involved in translation (DUF1610 family)